MLIVPRKRIWTQQPQSSVRAIPQALAVCMPILTNTGYGAVKGKPLLPHYGSGNTITLTRNGYIFSQTGYEDVREEFSAPYPNRRPITYFSLFSKFGSVGDYSFLVTGASNNGLGALHLMADGSLLWQGDSGQTVTSPAGIVSTGLHFAEVYLTSPSGSATRNTSIFLDGDLVAESSASTYYSNGQLVGPRAYSNQNNSATTVGVHLCGALNGRMPDLWSNPWQVIQTSDSPIFVPTGAGSGGGDSLTASSIIASPATVGSPLLSQQHALSASSIATAQAVVTSPTITQRHALSATAVSASPAVVGSPSITQRHALTATAISAAPAVVGSPTLTEIVAGILSALPIITAPVVVGTPAITQKHALSAGAISAGHATFGTPTLAQQHALIAHGITAAAAVVGLPILSEGGAVIFTSAPNGGGYSRAAENYSRPPQTNTARH